MSICAHATLRGGEADSMQDARVEGKAAGLFDLVEQIGVMQVLGPPFDTCHLHTCCFRCVRILQYVLILHFF